MKVFLFAAAVATATTPVFAADIGVSVNIGQPGFYGRIDIGNYPPPVLVYPQPIIIQPAPVYVEHEPVYLYVPSYQQRNWRRYCRSYTACGQPVYFVREDWYQRDYVPRYRHDHDDDNDHHGNRHQGRGHNDD